MISIILYSKVSNKILSRSIPAFKNLYTTLGNTAVKVKEVDDNDSVDLKYHDLDLNNTNNNNQERELIYQILSTVPSKREAQHFLDTYADSFPQSFNNSILLSNNKREKNY